MITLDLTRWDCPNNELLLPAQPSKMEYSGDECDGACGHTWGRMAEPTGSQWQEDSSAARELLKLRTLVTVRNAEELFGE